MWLQEIIHQDFLPAEPPLHPPRRREEFSFIANAAYTPGVVVMLVVGRSLRGAPAVAPHLQHLFNAMRGKSSSR